jgi:hypothetical protein
MTMAIPLFFLAHISFYQHFRQQHYHTEKSLYQDKDHPDGPLLFHKFLDGSQFIPFKKIDNIPPDIPEREKDQADKIKVLNSCKITVPLYVI